MNYLSVEELSKSYDEKKLFENITFGLDQGQKAALVGVNGTGKSTLMKVIAGIEPPDKGIVSFRKGLTVSMLPQHPEFDPNDKIIEAVFSGEKEELKVIRDYEMAMFKTEHDPANAPDLTPILEKMDTLNAWEYEHQIKGLLGKLGLHNLEQKMSDLSGGQKKRVALAQALVVNPDFLILDEPTNHLDLELIEWLENYLATANLTLLMVTHDRYFLDRVTNEILEIEHGKIYRYKGNYSQFLEKKAERMEMEAASIDKAKNLFKTELEWMRRQPKARGTKAKYRVDAFHDVKAKAYSGINEQKMEVNLKGERQGKKILELEHVSKFYDNQKLIEDFSYVFKRREKVGIIGPNGVGKSTFLNILAQQIKPDSGKIEVGQTTKFGYYTQDETIFDPGKKVLDIVKEVAEYIQLEDGSQVSASQLLNQFLFPPKMQHNFVGKLSGGEKRRLQLLRVLMANPNFLILDEPTNDLDITTLNVLEDYLQKFAGCLMVVSHDRYFMDRLVDHLFVFEGNGKIRDFPGNYTDYREKEGVPLAELPKQEKEKPKAEESSTEKPKSRKLSYNEQRELDQLDKDIPKLEARKAELQESLLNETEYEKLQEISAKIKAIEEELEEKEMRWLELSEV
ncbi:MAG: ABC-F family ATP-binding cassette domain-containing protein [Ekhidna sp.]|uniref:ABC-F family ATP-binding cassette domain-containing protein n=1 Tax=Ekhidna sp. TaxID=2608089 RepID=UPI0032EC7EC8